MDFDLKSALGLEGVSFVQMQFLKIGPTEFLVDPIVFGLILCARKAWGANHSNFVLELFQNLIVIHFVVFF